MNNRLELLQPYPFARLKKLLEGVEPNANLEPIRLSIGEPKHRAPQAAIEALTDNMAGLSKYPGTGGTDELKNAISNWLSTRFKLKHIDAQKQILPVNGTREALFAAAQAFVNGRSQADKGDKQSSVLMPNPFYQIYEGAALLAGSQPVFFNLDTRSNQPDFSKLSEADWQSCELMYICTPANPTGQSLPLNQFGLLIEKARKYNFVLISDECYSELYIDEAQPCTGLLQACEHFGINDYKNCLIFHSLSKRSNLPGLRSGFTAGDAELIEKFLLYRTYHGSAMPLHHQSASAAAWSDEKHVEENRALYRQKYQQVIPILEREFNFIQPDSGFYLWLETPVDDQLFTRDLYREMNLHVVPGSFLARDGSPTQGSAGTNPGQNRIRLALVGELDECVEAAHRLCSFVKTLRADKPA